MKESEKKKGQPVETAQSMIAEECDSIKEMLLRKNKAYGNSALNPVRVFSKSDNLEQIRVRMDDKLSRIRNMGADFNDGTEDTFRDLIGYMVLYLVAKRGLKGGSK